MNETEPTVLVLGASTPEPVVLNEEEVRVLGALIEKQVCTPDYYPLTLHALLNACNQTTSRDPVVRYDEAVVTRTLDRLSLQKLAYVFSGAESRVLKYGHKVVECFGLTPAETAVLCLLLLRGPQTVGELRNRSGRLHEFASLPEVEATLGALSVKQPQPLVVKLPRQMGCKESRYAHRLAGELAPESRAVPLDSTDDRVARLESEMTALRQELLALRREFAEWRQGSGPLPKETLSPNPSMSSG